MLCVCGLCVGYVCVCSWLLLFHFGFCLQEKKNDVFFVVVVKDEPTNHLDFPAVEWLTNYLIGYPKTLVVVSHDRK